MTSNKDKYGEVFTPVELVKDMLNDALAVCGGEGLRGCKRIFEPGAGRGVFYETFFEGGCGWEVDTYIMNDINEEHGDHLRGLVAGAGAGRSGEDEVMIQDLFSVQLDKRVDMILGNLPFHNGGKAFVPGLAKFHAGDVAVTKPCGIVTIWPKMIHYCFDRLLTFGGYFFCIIPCIWLKEDRAGIYDLFARKNQLILLKVFDCVRANALFGYNCQTPVCYVLVKKGVHVRNTFKLFDESVVGEAEEVGGGYIDFTLKDGYCIPTKHAGLFAGVGGGGGDGGGDGGSGLVTCYDKLKKISSLKPGLMDQVVERFDKGNVGEVGLLEDYGCGDSEHKVITGAAVVNERLILHGVISGMAGLYEGIPKLILPHKRLLRCFKDYDGTYSCYGRDMYVFLFEGESSSRTKIDALAEHLTSEPYKTMIERGFTIRMNFIEKYVFQYVPWVLLGG